jgi:hypothetical protein
MTTSTTTRPAPTTPRTRPQWRWLLTAFAFPPAGYLGHVIAGAVDSPLPALVGGALTGAGIGAAQWALLRHRGISAAWVWATVAGLAVGVAAGAAAVAYRTDITSLAVAGAVAGVAVGAAQATQLPARRVAWTLLTAVLWALGWSVTTSAGIDVESQYVVFGIFGSLSVAMVQASVLHRFFGARAT